MKHEIKNEATRAIVRGIITTIRCRYNVTLKEAEALFRRNVGDSEVMEAMMESIDIDRAEQKEYEKELADMP